MAKGAYVGVDGVAHKVKKIYTGVDNVARKVKKGYVGVGGVARPFFSAEAVLEYYGTITPLSLVKEALAATTVGNYAIFAGGKERNVTTDAMDYYTNSLVKGTGDLRDAKSDLAATTVGDYAIFAGGYVNLAEQGWNISYSVDTYDSSLTRRTGTILSQRRAYLAAATVGNHALFGGGDDSVDAYDTNLTRSTPTVLSGARRRLAATTVGDYALFGGGYGSSYKDTVDVYYQEDAQYVTLTFEFTNKDFGFNSGFPEGSDIYLCYAEDSSAVGAIDNKFSRVTNSMLEEQPPLTVRVKKGKILCLGFRTSESDLGRLADLKTDVLPLTNGSAGFLAYWGQTFFSLNPKYPYNEFYCSASVVNSLTPIDPVYPDEGEDWS